MSSPLINMDDANSRQSISSPNDRHEPTPKREHKPLNLNDALNYINRVKFTFSDEPQVFLDFLDVMKDFKQNKVDKMSTFLKIGGLFKGHPELIDGFNVFLPPGLEIEVKCGCPLTEKETELNLAINYLRKVEARFHDEPNKYKYFLSILRSCKSHHGSNAVGTTTKSQIYDKVAELFVNQQDLLLEFAKFLLDENEHVVSSLTSQQGTPAHPDTELLFQDFKIDLNSNEENCTDQQTFVIRI